MKFIFGVFVGALLTNMYLGHPDIMIKTLKTQIEEQAVRLHNCGDDLLKRHALEDGK